MKPRDRVLAAINHEEPDRVPICIGVSNATSLKMTPYRAIKELAGIEAPDEYIYQWPELGTAAPDEATLLRLRSDVRGVLDLEPAHVLQRARARPPHTPFVDSWGSGQVELAPGEWLPGLNPLREAATVEEVESYAGWPDMDDPTRVAHVRQQALRLKEQGEFAIMGTPWLLFPFERAHAMQGMDVFLLNMAENPDLAAALLRRITDSCKALMGNFLAECGDLLDIIKIGDDLGMQSGLLISPKMYRRVLKPLHAELIAYIKERTSAKVFFHTDGDVFDLIPDFVEIGIDILNPIQTSAGRMSNLAALKERYGQNMAFCGAIDTHRVLPFGTPAEVREEVRRVIQVLGPGGGYMLASVHTLMNDVSAENILAMVDAVEEFGRYPLG
ncbi:MAG TPA: uroporphyrinogen decarboxylase family protein [Anaerolineae bacterium]|nr:uroporphyrinogen decarboxylase family protein [Anaerolineae bacterium]